MLKAWSELSDDLKKNIVRSNLFISKTEKMEELSEDVFVIDNEREININVFKKATI